LKKRKGLERERANTASFAFHGKHQGLERKKSMGGETQLLRSGRQEKEEGKKKKQGSVPPREEKGKGEGEKAVPSFPLSEKENEAALERKKKSPFSSYRERRKFIIIGEGRKKTFFFHPLKDYLKDGGEKEQIFSSTLYLGKRIEGH